MSRHSSISSALTRLSHSSPNASNPLSTAPSPTDSVTRPSDSRSTVATWLASSAGRRRDGGVSNVPSRMREVRTAATASEIHASTPQTGSQTKIPSHPDSSAAAARSPTSSASAHGITNPNRIAGNPRRTDLPLGRPGHNVRAVDFELPPDDDERRLAVRAWLGEHPEPTGRELADAGYVVPHWPRPWGLDADPIHQLLIDDELARAGVRRPVNPIGIGWAGPTILYAGTKEQKDRYLWPMISGEEFWCQLFSEPGSGSDLANLGTRAVRDGDEFVVNGQKIWTSGAQYAQLGILIARTDPELPKHKGVSYFICPMDAAGIEIRPITEMTGGHTFNEVFFTDVRIPAANLVGELNDGWRLAKVTLGNERISLSSGGVLWGNGPTALDLIDAAKASGPTTDPTLRQRLAGVYIEHTVLELIRARTLTARLKGEQPGPEASIRKLLGDEHGQHVMELARDLVGPAAMLTGGDGMARPDGADFRPGTETRNLGPGRPPRTLDHPGWYDGFIFSRALTIGGGTGEVQRNIVAERVLGLPHDVDVQQGLSWSEAQRAGAR